MIPFNKYIIEPAIRKEDNDPLYLKTLTKYVIIYIIISAIIEYIIAVFFKIRLNAIVVPILFISVFYGLYKSILFSIRDTGTSIGFDGDNIERRKRGQGVKKIINSFSVFLNKIPGVIVKIPKITEPEYNFQPFISIREDIRTLQLKIVNEKKFTVNISIPSPKIDFVDPLAAMCCAWDKMKELINQFIELINPVLDPIKNAMRVITNLVKNAKELIIDPMVNLFYIAVGSLKNILKPPLLLFLGLIQGVNAISDDKMKSEETDVQGFYDSLKGGRTNLKSYENKFKGYYTYFKSDDDDFYDLKRYKKENKIKSQAGRHFNKKITTYTIYKLYKKGGVDYVIHCLKKYKNKKFNSYCKKRNKTKKKYRDIYNNKLNNDIESELRDLIKKRYDIEENNNNNIKTTFLIKGGISLTDATDKLNKAIRMLAKIAKLLRDLTTIPPKLKRALGKAGPILKKIGKYALNIIKNIDKILVKFGKIIFKMLIIVRALLAWYLKFVILKGIGIVQQAINLVQLLGLVKPSWTTTANKVLEVPKIILMAVVDILFFPFEDVLLAIKSVVNTVKNTLNSIVNSIRDIIDDVVNTARSILNKAKEYWEGLKNTAQNLVDDIGSALSNTAANVGNTIARTFSFGGGSTNINYSDNKIIFYIDGNKLILDKSYNKDIDTILLHIWGNLLINPKTKHIKQKTIIYK